MANGLNGNSKALIALVSLLSGVILSGTVAYFAADKRDHSGVNIPEIVRAEWDDDVLRLEIKIAALEGEARTGALTDERRLGQIDAIKRRLDFIEGVLDEMPNKTARAVMEQLRQTGEHP